MNLIKSVEDLAATVGTNVETFFDTEFHAFIAAAMPLYNDLKAFAQATGNADLATLLTDLKQDLVTAELPRSR